MIVYLATVRTTVFKISSQIVIVDFKISKTNDNKYWLNGSFEYANWSTYLTFHWFKLVFIHVVVFSCQPLCISYSHLEKYLQWSYALILTLNNSEYASRQATIKCISIIIQRTADHCFILGWQQSKQIMNFTPLTQTT